MNYTVKPGDCMASIAAEHHYLMETLWNLAENADLKSLRKDPYILLPGDQVFIPDLRHKDETAPVDKSSVFKLKGAPEKIRIVVTDEEDRPLAGKNYVLQVDADRFEGQTDGAGAVERTIRPTAQGGWLAVKTGGDWLEYVFKLGHVDPADTITGAQGRLLDLGYYDGPIDGRLSGRTQSALLLFQDKYDLQPSGEIDGATKSKLKEVFGC